ncbi:MAG: hypothetical protein M2R45_04672 [Verrucomicrobia subdivision 3 bacterium]|nr:hypothetical protein [Limisphaerales bacterium]MCS1416595.1 hypothetical protein [Limisphaerales bacterium]
MKVLFEVEKMSFFDCSGVWLMLSMAEKPEFDHPSSVLYFKVKEVTEHYERLAEDGVKFEAKPHLVAPMLDHDLWMAFFRDSENNLLALMSEEPKATK